MTDEIEHVEGNHWRHNGQDVWMPQGATEADVLTVVSNANPPPTLEQIKDRYRTKVDKDAEAVRLKYLTPGAGQAMTYQEKFSQAEAVNALGQAAADALTQEEYELAYPVLSASVGIEAASLWDCAQLVIQRYVAFNVLANVIEKTRLQGKKNINDAADGAGVIAAYEAITWTV